MDKQDLPKQLSKQVRFTAKATGQKASEGDGRTAADVRRERAEARARKED